MVKLLQVPSLEFLVCKKRCTLKRNQEANNIWQSVSFLNGSKTNRKRTDMATFLQSFEILPYFCNLYNFLASYRF